MDEAPTNPPPAVYGPASESQAKAPTRPPTPPPTAQATPPEPPPDYGIVWANLTLQVEYPTVGQPAPFLLAYNTTTGDEPMWAVVGVDAAIDGVWANLTFESFEPTTFEVVVYGREPLRFNVTADPWNKPYDFGSPDGKLMRPGAQISGCSANAMFTWQWERYFFATAAHCVTEDEPVGALGETGNCDGTPWSRDEPVPWAHMDGEVGYIAYNSVEIMQELGWTYDDHSNACMFNDFALIEMPLEHLPKMHPSMLAFGGPTHLANASALVLGDELRGFGSSALRYISGDYARNPVTMESNKKAGFVVEKRGDFAYNVYAITPAIPGDSGSPMLTIDGGAWGIASTLRVVGGQNTYARLDACLDFMEAHVGWRPTLITSHDWDPTLP